MIRSADRRSGQSKELFVVQLSCAIVDADATNRQELATFLQAHAVTALTPLQRIDQLEPLLTGKEPPRLVIVHIDPDPQSNIEQLAPLIRAHPGTSFFV